MGLTAQIFFEFLSKKTGQPDFEFFEIALTSLIF
jgi:hypothetical protein